ncbi:MAG TPA: cytochrome c oxidase assembly protein [Candidatus Limnocylindrales bacterium]|nr:cytochrome c oxidase assembly protein [Candidatus Limnocylindrales bacterium]
MHPNRARPASAFAALAVIVVAGPAAGPVAAHGAVPAAPPDAATLLLGWSFEPVLVLPLLFAAAAWWRLLDGIDRAHPERPVSRFRRWSFLAGLAAIAVALQSGIERYDTTLFSIHMVQHLILTLVAPVLLALGAPVTQLLRAASPATRERWLLPILHSRAVAVLAHPVIAWLVFVSVLWTTHFSPLFDLALEDPLLHDLEHALFLGAALLFWWPVVGLDPAPHRMGFAARLFYLFLQMPQSSFLAMAILFADAPLYPHYLTLGAPYGIDALADQRLAAGIMWFVGDVWFLGALLVVLAGWMRSEDRGAAAAERRADAERAAIRDRETVHRARRAAGEPPQAGTGEASSSR